MTNHEFTHQDLILKANLKIRIGKAADVKKLEWNGQFTHFRNLFRRAYTEQRKGKRLMLVMDFNGYPIARLFIQFYKAINSKDVKRGYIYSFTVMEPFRSLGIGTRMLSIAETTLMRRDYPIATISVAKHNTRAIKLYIRRGYEIYGEDAGQWQYQDHRGISHQMNEPSFLMKKALRNLTNLIQT